MQKIIKSGFSKDDYFDPTDIHYELVSAYDAALTDRIVELTHLMPTSIDYGSDKSEKVIWILFGLWEKKRPGELQKYIKKIKEIRDRAYNSHVTGKNKKVRFLALMPSYFDLLIHAVWPTQEYDARFYSWFLDKFACFKVPEGSV